VAVLVQAMPSGLARLKREGFERQAAGDLLGVPPIVLPPGAIEPSRLVAVGRTDRLRPTWTARHP
jgi:hypothetical protein